MSNDIRQTVCLGIYPDAMDEKPAIDPVRKGLGMRLASARESKGFTQDDIAKRFSINKGTVSAWETGRGDPGVYRLRELAKLYDVSADALLWEDSLTPDAMKVAAQFDELNERQKRTFYAMWMAYVQATVSDAGVEAGMPITKNPVFDYEKPALDYSGPERRKK